VSHACPQLPQLFALVCVLMQLPVQHSCAAVHVRVHAPQFATEVSVFTHVFEQHAIEPPPQLGCDPHMQTPATHVSPAAQPGVQVAGGVQTPATHVLPPVQLAPVPQ